MSPSKAIAQFAVGLRLDQVPEAIREKAKLMVLDTLGVSLAATAMNFGRMAIQVARGLGGPAQSRIVGTAWSAASANAALANGTLAHGLDYDDTLEESQVHSGCCAVPAALAVAEEVGATGSQLLEAVLLGIETTGKIGLAVPGRFHAMGFHPTSLCGTFAAGAVAARLYGLNLEQIRDTLGICGSQSSGIIECMSDGTWSKRFHAGWAGHAGIIAAKLAARGYRGPRFVFEGAHGFYRAFAGEDGSGLRNLVESFGRTWETSRATFKPYPCGAISHPYMDCALRLKKRYHLSPEKIEKVICRTAEGPIPILWEPLGIKRRPQSAYAAKFSLPFSIAAILARGKAGLGEFSDEAILDRQLLDLADRVGYQLDPTVDFPRHFSGHVRIVLKGGTVLEENQPYPRGGLEFPLTAEEIEEKFRANASLALPRDKVKKVVTEIRNLENVRSIRGLAKLLTPAA